MKNSETLNIVLPIWAAVLFVALPLLWSFVFDTPYFLYGARGLQQPDISAPILFMSLCWALVLSVPQLRTPNLIGGAGGSLLATGFFLMYYSQFANTGGLIFLILGQGLLRRKK